MTVPMVSVNGNYIVGAKIKVDSEIMNLSAVNGATLTVTRGFFGTTPASHAAGTTVAGSTNSLQNQVWLPMASENGHTYLTTWDVWHSGEQVRSLSGQTSWKTFQFRRA